MCQNLIYPIVWEGGYKVENMSIFRSAPQVTLQKCFSCLSLVIYFFSNHKQKIGERLLVTCLPLGPIKPSSQSLAGVSFAVSFTSLCILVQIQAWNYFAEPNWHGFTFLLFKDHILSINRAALIQKCYHLFTPHYQVVKASNLSYNPPLHNLHVFCSGNMQQMCDTFKYPLVHKGNSWKSIQGTNLNNLIGHKSFLHTYTHASYEAITIFKAPIGTISLSTHQAFFKDLGTSLFHEPCIRTPIFFCTITTTLVCINNKALAEIFWVHAYGGHLI
jgi:hypothetical protein